MSKAFVSENDEAEEPDLPEEDEKLPQEFKNYMTPGGAAKLKVELRSLLYQERPELLKVIQWAASNGDRSENGDYIYGKRRLREIDRRIRFLTKRLESAVIVDPAQQTTDRVLFGAQVTIEDEGARRRTFQIVGVDETDVSHGKISWISPIAKALLNAKVGEAVTLRTPKGEEEIEVISISLPQLNKKRVLIVEDVESMRELLKIFIEGLSGLEISGAAGSIREAQLQLLRSRPSLVLLDEVMPGESNLDFLAVLVQEEIPVILMTGVESPAHPLPSAAFGRLVKPGWRSRSEDQARFQAEIDRALKVHG